MRRKKKRIFDNEKVSRLLSEYIKGKRKDEHLRNRILKLTVPLIDAAITRKKLHQQWRDLKLENKQDLRQECVLKVLQAIPKYDDKRGKAFAFFWSTICNMCISWNQRSLRTMDNTNSLSSDEETRKEAEVSGKATFQTPENSHILASLAASLQKAFDSNGFKVPKKSLHRKTCRDIRSTIATGEFFYDRHAVLCRLRRGGEGLSRKEIQYYIDYTLVILRQRLLKARENSDAMELRKISKHVSAEPDL